MDLQELKNYQTLWNNACDIVLVLDKEGKIVFGNTAAQEAYGYKDLTKLSIRDLSAENTVAELEKQFRDALKKGTIFETVHRHKNGTVFPVEVSSHRIEIDKNPMLLSIVRDITQRKSIENDLLTTKKVLEKANQTLESQFLDRTNELEQSQKFLRAIMDTVMDPIFVKDRNHRWIEGNTAFWDLLGGEKNAKGKTDYDFFPPEQADHFWSGDDRVFAGEKFDEEEKLLKPDGTEIIIATKKVAFNIANGEQGLVGVIRDVTHQRKIEAEIRKHRDHLAEMVEERQRLALEASHSFGTWDWDVANDVFTADQRFAALFGLSAEEAKQGVKLEQVARRIHADDYPDVEKAIQDILQHGGSYHQEYRVNQNDGSVRWISARGHVQFDAEGKAIRFPGVGIDITKEREALDALRSANQKKDEFLATLAHELRNPLAPIQNSLYLFKSGAIDSSIRAKAYDVVERQITQMVRLVDDLMDVSRITTGKIELQCEILLLGNVIENALEISRPIINEYHHALDVQIPDEPIYVYGDMVRLSQIFANLLNNAAKYTDKDGKICLKAYVENGFLKIEISDNGIGISNEVMPYIFDMFSQADTSIEKARGGLGIGLTITKRLIELHDGFIDVKSEGQGKGSLFTVSLPLKNKDCSLVASGAQADKNHNEGRLLKILVVDDNVASAQTLVWTLGLLNCKAEMAHSGKEALEFAGNLKPDIIFLDIGMPDMNGYDICKNLKKRPELENALFIAQTGWGQVEHRERSKKAGFHYHLVKPLDLKEIKKILQEYRNTYL